MDCVNCGKKLVNVQKKYCSSKCAGIVNGRLYPKRSTTKVLICPYCKKEFKMWGGNTKYCSQECHNNNIHKIRIEKFIKGELSDYQCRSSAVIRPYIAKHQGNKCAICDIDAVWNNKKLNFVMDHIDGNHNNNLPSNLRLVCPNCDSQLPTYKSKNSGNGRAKRKKHNL